LVETKANGLLLQGMLVGYFLLLIHVVRVKHPLPWSSIPSSVGTLLSRNIDSLLRHRRTHQRYSQLPLLITLRKLIRVIMMARARVSDHRRLLIQQLFCVLTSLLKLSIVARQLRCRWLRCGLVHAH
jgi:hypothetical protein